MEGVCTNHPDRPSSHVPWWPYTHFLDVECGYCPECVEEFRADTSLDLVEIDTDRFWECQEDMRDNLWSNKLEAESR
jgi:hypothetical protein